MKTIGKEIRMERIINRKSHKTVIVPLDHGVSVGPISGLEDIAKTINDIAEGGANAVLMHKGIVGNGHRGYGRDIGLIIHLSGGTSLSEHPNNRVQVTSVKEAVRLGEQTQSQSTSTSEAKTKMKCSTTSAWSQNNATNTACPCWR